MVDSEEYTVTKQVWGWLAIIALCVFVLGWGMCLMMLMPDVERHWDYNITPLTPASSVYSTSDYYKVYQPETQIEKLPEARPTKKEEKEKYQVIRKHGNLQKMIEDK